jgi:serine/threonine-protein kinase
MSPEQCKDSADVDLRSDVYSFAIIVYEMLAGRTPYVAASGTEMLIMHLTGTPAPLRELVPDLPAPIEAAIRRALARAREERFDSIASFVGALRGETGTAILSRQSPSEELPAAGQGPAAGLPRTATLPSVTTLLRGEVGVTAGDDAEPAPPRHRRWPLLAFGGVATAGFAVFLLLRPSHDSGPRPPPGPLAAADAAIVVVAPRSALPDAGVAVRKADGAVPVVGARPVGKAAHVDVAQVGDGARTATRRVRVAGQPRPPVDYDRNRREEDERLKVH